MKLMRKVCAFAALTLLTAGGALATTATSAKVRVPFEFAVNGNVLPAGLYSISAPDGAGVVVIRSEASRGSILAIGGRSAAPAPGGVPRLVFVKKEGRMHLSEVQARNSNGSAWFPVK